MPSIIDLTAREILDSRGNPTVECDVTPGKRRLRPGRGPLRRLDRCTRGGRATRRRQIPLPAGKGVRTAIRAIEGEIMEAIAGPWTRPSKSGSTTS